MNIETKNGMRIITPKFGCRLHNKNTDTYTKKAYLPLNSDLNIWEEVYEDNSKELYDKMEEVEKKEQSLTKVAKIVANSVTDDAIALQIQEFYDEWDVDINVTVGQYIRYEDILYKVLTAHTTQANWTPSNAPSLFAKVLIDPTGETVLEWEQPDSTNPYMKGDKVTYGGKTYTSIIDNNIWAPDVYGWEVII